jgi:hypothetical protein
VPIDGALEKLCLTAISMRRDDQTPGHDIRHRGAKVSAHNMQAQIEPCRTAR